ncbi:MAG: LPS assembly protein LptD [Verrucomicrobiaceae bacterium]|nr:LPS assembly protein LptD [Verrucomicrobiaceae bacterium]
MRTFRLLALTFAMPFMAGAQLPTDSLLSSLESNVDIEGLETSFDPETGIASAKGNVHIKYGDTEIKGQEADYNYNTGDVIARGSVTVVKAGVIYQGERIVYNTKTNDLHGADIRSGMMHKGGQLFYEMDSFETETKYVERVDGEGAFFTTHDVANPNYKVKARKITIYPDDRIVMKGVKVYAGNTPIFWLPYMSQPLDDEVGYTFSPGYGQNWGAFLLNQYGVIHGDHTLAKYHLDLRSARGIAGGADFISMKHKDNPNIGRLKLYYANDSDPLRSQAKEVRTDVDSSRYRINFQHRIYITGPASRTWHLDFDINKMSDEFFYEDFFMEEFRSNREPDNQVSLVRTDPRYTATLMAKFQLNDFYTTDTRLPEVAFDFTRSPIFNTGLFYQGNTSWGFLKEKLGSVERLQAENTMKSAKYALGLLDKSAKENGEDGDLDTLLDADKINRDFDFDNTGLKRTVGLDPAARFGRDEVEQSLALLQTQLSENSFQRIHSYHEVLMPKTLFGWLNLVPRIGGGVTHYSSVEGGDLDLSSDTRPIFHAGMDVSFKLTKTWEDVSNPGLGLNGLKHTIQPYINYSYLNADEIEGLPAIDQMVPTTRPRPLDVPMWTAIDDLRSWNIARVGVRNLLQTRRDYTSTYQDWQFRTADDSNVQTYSWAGLNTYVDVFMDDPEFDRSMGNLYNELFWSPVPWIRFWADTQLPIAGDDANFTEANYGITYRPIRALSLSLGHQFLSDHPFFPDSSLVYSRIYARLNENWGLSANHVYELDDGTLEYQSYALHRDLSSWVASIGALVRDNRGATDYGLIFSMTLKEFPQVSLPLDMDPNPTGRGGNR